MNAEFFPHGSLRGSGDYCAYYSRSERVENVSVSPSAAESARLTQSWYRLYMKDEDTPDRQFPGGRVLRKQISSHGTVFDYIHANQLLVRNSCPCIGVHTNISLTNAELVYQVFGDVVFSAYGHVDISGEPGRKHGTGHALAIFEASRAFGVLHRTGEVNGVVAAAGSRMNDHRDVCVLFTLYRSFYPSASSTTSVRAGSSILEEKQVLWSQRYATKLPRMQ